MKIIKFLIVLMLFYNSCVSIYEINNKDIKKIAVNDFYIYYKSIMNYYEKEVNFEQVDALTHFEGIINSPFKKTKFYKYSFTGLEPNIYNIVFVNEKEASILEPFRLDNDQIEGFVSKVTLENFNNLLNKEDRINEKNVLDFIKFIFVTSNIKYNFLEIMNNNPSIIDTNTGDNIFPEEISREIKSPEVKISGEKLIVVFFCWNKCSTELFKFTVSICNNRIEYVQQKIGNYGEPCIIL